MTGYELRDGLHELVNAIKYAIDRWEATKRAGF